MEISLICLCVICIMLALKVKKMERHDQDTDMRISTLETFMSDVDKAVSGAVDGAVNA